MIRDSFIKVGRETKSPFITNPFRFAGAEWATALTNWLKRKPLTINGAAKTPTLDDDFTSDNFNDTGTKIGVANNTLEWDGAQNGSVHGSTIDLTSINTKAVFRAKLRINTLTAPSSASSFILIGFSDSDHTTAGDSSQDGIGLIIQNDADVANTFRAMHVDGAPFSPNAGTVFATVPATATDYFIEVVLDVNTWYVRIYSDSDYSTLTEEETGSLTATGLRYFGIKMRSSASVGGTFDGYIDDLQFWNGVTTVENIPSQQTADLDDDFTTDNTTSTGDDIVYDGVGDEIDYSFHRASTGQDTLSVDFGSVLSDRWVAHFKLDVDTITGADTSNSRGYIVLSDKDGTTTVGTSMDAIGLYVNINSVSSTYNLIDRDAAVLSTVADGTFAHEIAVETLYVEIIRKSSSLYTINLYSDSSYSTLVESLTTATNGTPQNLRYLYVARQDASGSGNTMVGSIDDLKIWNNITEVNPTTLTDYPLPIKIIGDTNLQRKTAETFEDIDFPTANWNKAGATNGLTINDADDRIDFEAGTATETVVHDLGSTQSDVWRLDFHVHNTTVTKSNTDNVELLVHLSDSDQTEDANTSQEHLGVRIVIDTAVDDVWLQGGTGTLNGGDVINNIVTTGYSDKSDYYFTLLSTSSTNARLIIYADSARNISLYDTGDIAMGTPINLRYIKIATDDDSASNVFNGYVDTIRFWNGITNPVTQETATLDDNFTSYANTTEGDAAYPTSDTAKARVNPTNDNIDYTFTGNNSSTHEAIVHDLQDEIGIGNYLDSKFCVRFSNKITAHANSAIMYCGLTDQDESTGSSDAHTFIGYELLTDSTDRWFATQENASAVTNRDTTTNRVWVNDEVLYWEIIRDNLTYTINLYTDSSYSILDSTATNTMEADYTNLQYLKFMNRDNTSATQAITGVIDDIQVWNGVTSPNATGRKFVFTNDAFDGNAVEYASEAVSYDPINGDWTGYVRIPSLTAGADTTIQMYYDYSAANPSYVPELFTSMPTADSVFGVNGDQVIEDCTTYANTTEGDADYVPSVTGTNECRLNPSTDVIDCRFEDNSADHFVAYRDLTGTTITDNAWTLRCKVATTVITAPSGGLSHSVYIGMSDNTSNFATSQDFLGISFWNPGASESPNTPKHYAVYRDSAIGGMSNQAPAASSVVFSTAWTNTDTYYIEIIRVSNTKLTVELFSDSAYTTSVEKQTVSVPSTVTGLRYFKAGVFDNANVVGFTMTIDDLEFWEGVNKNREQSTYDSNYKAVYHLQGNSIDSTAYGNDGTDTSVDWQQQNNSVGLLSSGASTDINVGSDASLDNIFDGGGMISCYINPLSNGEAANARIIDKSTTGWTYRVSNESAGTIDVVFLVETSGTIGRWETTTALTLGELNKVDLYYNSDNVTTAPIFLINGNKVSLTQTSTPTGTRADDSAHNMRIGDSNAGGESFDGFIDNVKISDKIRPSSEAITSYNAEKSDSDIITKGNELTQ